MHHGLFDEVSTVLVIGGAGVIGVILGAVAVGLIC